MKRHLCALLIALSALSAAAPAWAQQADKQSPDQMVKSAFEGVMSAIKTDPEALAGDPDKVESVVREKFLPYTDFYRSTQIAVGSDWSKATPEQRQALFEQFQTLMTRTYTAQLIQIRDQKMDLKIRPMAPVPPDAAEALVRTIVAHNGDTENIDYRVHKTDAGWKIYDVNIMGSWLTALYQQQFADQIRKGGIEGLLNRLQQHNRR